MTRPLPQDALADELDRPFWAAANDGVLLVHRCRQCGRCYWPASCCVDHGGGEMEWVPATGFGTVHTFTVFRRQYHPAFEPPYCVAVVQVDEGPFFHTNIVGDPSEVYVGQRVQVEFVEIAPDVRLPMFRAVTEESER